MSIDTGIQTFLAGMTGVTDNFGNRFFPDRLPTRGTDGAALTFPSLTYQRLSGIHEHQLANSSPTTVTLDPATLVSNSPAWTLSGGTLPGIVNDDGDLTWMSATDNLTSASFTFDAMPGNATTTSAVNFRLRMNSVLGWDGSAVHAAKCELFTGSGLTSQGAVTITTTPTITPTWFSGSLTGLSVSKADMDVGQLVVDSSPYVDANTKGMNVIEIEIVPTYTSLASIASGVVESRIQFDVWATSNAQRSAAAEALRNAMDGYQGFMGTADVRSVMLQNEIDGREDPTSGNETGIYRRTMDFKMVYKIGVPTLT